MASSLRIVSPAVALLRSLLFAVARWLRSLVTSRSWPGNPRGGSPALGFAAARPVVGQERANLVLVRVSVHAPGGTHYEGEATVSLRQGDRLIRLEREPGLVLYEGLVEPGVYSLEVSGEGLVAPARLVDVGPAGKTAAAYLGLEDWPAYRLGENIVPFEPQENLLAVVFETQQPDPEEARRLVGQALEGLPLVPYDFAPGEALPFAAANGAIWLFELTDPAQRERLVSEIPQRLGRDARVGMPVDLVPGQVKVLDNQFVVRFREGLSPEEIDAIILAAELVESVDPAILRTFIPADNTRLIAFRRGDYRAHLDVIEDWFGRNLLVYGEPDLLAEISDGSFPSIPPDDGRYGNQTNLRLQEVDKTWMFLNSLDPDWTLGGCDVYLATLDRGVQIAHPDIGGTLSDGTNQLAVYFDFVGMQDCLPGGCTPDTSHGMGVYGIVAARTNNHTAIAGIAPNTHQIAIKRLNVDSVIYKDVLLWIAGIDNGTGNGNIPPNWPNDPIGHPADIINCSHVVKNMTLAGYMNDTLTKLTTQGRNGLGAVVIYGAGNDTACITGTMSWATHPRVMAIANSNHPDAAGVERYNSKSNYGYEIDLCARGSGVRSLNDFGTDTTFDGTSASAPTVAAAAALMLTVKPTLTWSDVRQILCDTAEKIDVNTTDPIAKWDVNGFSQRYGYGRLNVCKAVQAAEAFP